jgi:hypothetical protein
MSDESLSDNQNNALALEWLAKFNQVGFGSVTKLGTGGNWAMAERPDELQRLSCERFKNAASTLPHKIQEKLSYMGILTFPIASLVKNAVALTSSTLGKAWCIKTWPSL